MGCKSMATSMLKNMKLLSDSFSDLVDPTLYIHLIRSLMYLVNTKSDICFSMSTLIHYMTKPIHVHWITIKQVLRYLHDTVGYGLRYVLDGDEKSQGYI
jgi:hypothetical protein